MRKPPSRQAFARQSEIFLICHFVTFYGQPHILIKF